MTDLEKARTNYELAIQIFANNPTDENAKFYKLQQKIYDHVHYGKMTPVPYTHLTLPTTYHV